MATKINQTKKQSNIVPSLPPEQAAQLLIKQLDKGKHLLETRPITNAANQTWETVTREVLSKAFGPDSPNVASFMDVGRYDFMFADNVSEVQWEKQRFDSMTTRLEIIDGLIELLNSHADLTETGASTIPLGNSINLTKISNRVFLVHGHNELAIQETARFMEKFDLDVIILREQPNSGRTIIEKFIDFSDVGFSVVLLTSDDLGGAKEIPHDKQKPRARQNVILELGFFLGKLGRKRVCALYQEGIEIPSDYDGVIFIPLDKNGAWHMLLARELKSAGLSIDLNKAL
jgi:predicted nucleotide-binding protein